MRRARTAHRPAASVVWPGMATEGLASAPSAALPTAGSSARRLPGWARSLPQAAVLLPLVVPLLLLPLLMPLSLLPLVAPLLLLPLVAPLLLLLLLVVPLLLRSMLPLVLLTETADRHLPLRLLTLQMNPSSAARQLPSRHPSSSYL